MKKELTKGETVSWGQWGLLVFSGEFTPASNVATLVPAAESTKAAKAENEMRLFSNRTYYAMNGVPSGLDGLTYFMDGIETGATVKAVTSGTAYIMIPSGTSAYKGLENEVIAAGWSAVAYKPLRLAVGLLFYNRLYAKNVEVDEEIHFGKYNIIFGAAYENASDYYVMPSLTTPAEIITNPVGDKYDTNKQNWLGCPTIEKTSGGRVYRRRARAGNGQLRDNRIQRRRLRNLEKSRCRGSSRLGCTGHQARTVDGSERRFVANLDTAHRHGQL